MTNQPALPTFMDHVQELRGRLFWIAVFFIVASASAYPFRDAIISFLVAPLQGQELYYLTPIGGFSFIIKICTYVGAILTLPAMVYHLYRYLQPAVGHIKKRVVAGYVAFSLFLSLGGLAFAYFVIIPAALYFLTGLNITGVQAMLTIDSYYSFVMTYMIGVAVLFQLPLVLLLINAITPLKPKKLMGYQRFVILGAFISAAIISPTPDATNQALLAVPVIVMYQIGILLVLIRNGLKRKHKKERKQAALQSMDGSDVQQPEKVKLSPTDELAWIDELLETQHKTLPALTTKQVNAQLKGSNPAILRKPTPITVTQAPVMDMMRRPSSQQPQPRTTSVTRSAFRAEARLLTRSAPHAQQNTLRPARRSIDGVSLGA